MKTLRILPLLALLLVAALPVAAQNVSISPASGHLLMSNPESLPFKIWGAKYGFRSLWRHDQLPLTLMVGDTGDLTPGGELANPSGNIVEDYQSEDGTDMNHDAEDAQYGVCRHLCMGGTAHDLFFSVTLPKGYHITGYRLALLNNCNAAQTIHGLGSSDTHFFTANTKTVYETDATFSTTEGAYYAKSGTMGTENETNEYVVERTSTNGGRDMANHIYFCVKRETEGSFWAFTIKSFVLYFTAEGSTEITVAPLSIQTGSTNNIKSPFETGRPTLGALEPYTPLDKTYLAYKTENVHSLVAYNLLYQDDAVGSDGNIVNASSGKIIKCWNDGIGDGNGHFRYGLKNGTYYVETPTHAYTSADNALPLGLRITRAKIHYTYGTPVTAGGTVGTDDDDDDTSGGSETVLDGVHKIIRYTVATQDADGTTTKTYYYLNSKGLFTSDRSQAQTWMVDENNHVHTPAADDGTQLWLTEARHRKEQDDGKATITHTLAVTSFESEALVFKSGQGTGIYWEDKDEEGKVLTRYIAGTTSSTDAPKFNSNTERFVRFTSPRGAAFTPAAFTVKVYDKTGQTVEHEQSVSSTTADGYLEIDDLNNDAIKFEISDLTGTNAHALIYVTLTVEGLNPYINRMRVVCHNPALDNIPEAKGNTKIAQVFTADDFKVKGGQFTFHVPTGFYSGAEAQGGLEFTFENLFSRYADETYPFGSAEHHHSRYYFKLSDYDTNGTYAPDADNASTKINTVNSYDKMFIANNMDNLSSMSTGTATFQEWGFDDDKITNQEIESSVLKLKSGSTGHRMLVVADEPRYSIGLLAGHHRSYAYYAMDVTLEQQDYTPVAEWTKIYDTTLSLDGNYTSDEGAMWGVKFTAQAAGQQGLGYITYQDIENEIDKQTGVDRKHILYIDASGVDGVLYSSNTSGETGNHLDNLRQELSPNALVFLPKDASSLGVNFCCRKEDGDFRASNDIVLTDKQPFFTPYNIQLSSENYARYTRGITMTGYHATQHATIMLPFGIEINSDRVHENSDGTQIRLYQMQQSNCLSVNADKASEANNYFSSLQRSEFCLNASAANTPYMIEAGPLDNATSFRVEQRGAEITATPHTARVNESTAIAAAALTDNTAATGTFGTQQLTFTGYGSYCGQKLTAASSPAYFYFSQDMLLNSQYITDSPTLNILPFRAYWATSQTSAARAIQRMTIVFGDNPNSGSATGVTTVNAHAYSVTAAAGGVTVTAATACHVVITSAAGTSAASLTLKAAGETRTVALPAGVYLVGGRKVIVGM